MIYQQMVNAVVIGSIYALFGLGLNIVLGKLNILNIAHPAFFTMGGLIGLYLISSVRINFVVAILLVMIISGGVAVLLEALVFRPLRNRGMDRMSYLTASIGASMVLITLLQHLSGSKVLSFPFDALPDKSYHLFGQVKLSFDQALIILCAAVLIAFMAWFDKTKSGKALRAIEFSETTSKILGINTQKTISQAFFMSGALGGASGVLIGIYLSSVHFMIGEPFMLKGFFVIVLGGFGSIPGTVIASYLLGGIETFSMVLFSGAFRDAISFVILFILLVLRPSGLFSKGEEVKA